jgi:hypothetical protein
MFAALLPQCLSSETAWSCWKQAGTAVHILLHARGVGILWTQILGHHLHQAALLLLTRMCAFLKSSIKRLLALLGEALDAAVVLAGSSSPGPGFAKTLQLPSLYG